MWKNGYFLPCSLLFLFVIVSRLNIFVCIIMTALKKIKSHPNVVDYFKEFPFSVLKLHIKKSKIKRLKNIDLFLELAFYEELNVIKTNHAFRGYAISYKDELVEKKRSN